MRKFIILLVFISGVVLADYHYDYNSGNSYSTSKNYDGSTTVNGYNSHGKSWNTHIDNHGNMNGTDKNGNYWTYNKDSGAYHNSNGKSCYGHGATRTCN